MRAVLQRVTSASVRVDGQAVSAIGRGLLVLVGVAQGDGEPEARWMAEKTANLRIFEDDGGKMNLSVLEAGGEVLAVSQFTLLADARKGRRPGFSQAAAPKAAEAIYLRFAELLREQGCPVKQGVFRAHMEVSLVNDGPVTIVLDSPFPGDSRVSRR